MFQSLLSQGISLLNEKGNKVTKRRKKMFQSLLSQGISLLRVKAIGADVSHDYVSIPS